TTAAVTLTPATATGTGDSAAADTQVSPSLPTQPPVVTQPAVPAQPPAPTRPLQPGLTILPSVISGPWVTTASTVPLKGTATDNVTRVTWSVDWGGSGTASGTRAWTIPTIGLQIGKNVITVTAMTADGRVDR